MLYGWSPSHIPPGEERMLGQADGTPITIETLTTKFEASTLSVADLLVAGIAIAAGVVLAAATRTALKRTLTNVPGMEPMTALAAARIVGYLIIVFGVVVALSALGLDFGPVITLLLMIALVAVLVGRPMLADLGAGVVLQSRRPLRAGDVIRTADVEGVVEDIDARVVRLRTWDGWQVRVRNSDVLTDPIVNIADPGRVREEFTIGLHYDADLDVAVDVIARALIETPDVRGDRRPEALVNEFDDSRVVVRCRFWTDPERRWSVKDVAMRRVRRSLDEAGIAIAYPQRVVHTP